MFKVRIRELRESAGYKSQQSFADAFGVAQSTVGGWEAGKREPNFQTLMRLADFFDTTLDYLLGRTSEAPFSKSNISSDDLSDVGRSLLITYRTASSDDRAIIDNIVNRYTHFEAEQHLA